MPINQSDVSFNSPIMECRQTNVRRVSSFRQLISRAFSPGIASTEIVSPEASDPSQTKEMLIRVIVLAKESHSGRLIAGRIGPSLTVTRILAAFNESGPGDDLPAPYNGASLRRVKIAF